jgi:hypothetical protein
MTTKKLSMMVAGLALALATLAAPSAAEACGPYGPPTAEDVATQQVWQALAARKVDRFVSWVDVTIAPSGKRGVATIHYNSKRAPQRVSMVLRKGTWTLVTARRPRATA